MKWHWLVVGLAAGALLLGCEGGRQPVEIEEEPIPATAQTALQAVDTAVADFEKALDGTDIEATRQAAKTVTRKLGSLASFLSDMDLKAAEDARKAGTQPPPAVTAKLRPAITAADEAFGALVPPTDDVAKAKELLPQIKSGVDAVRDLVK